MHCKAEQCNGTHLRYQAAHVLQLLLLLLCRCLLRLAHCHKLLHPADPAA